MLRNLNSNFRFQIRPVTGRDFPVTAVTGNPDPPRDFFAIGNQNLAWCWSPCYTHRCGELAWGERRSPHRADTPHHIHIAASPVEQHLNVA
jgi:hypothetical protein